jgi:hypothetical protein
MARPNGSKNTSEGITRADFAKATGWSLTKVADMCRAGLIPLLAQAGKPMRTWPIDPKVFATMKLAGQRAYAETANPQIPPTDNPEHARKGQGTGAVADYWVHRAKKEAANAALAELKVQQERGKLLDRDDLEEAIFNMYRMTRDRLLSTADRLAHVLVNVASERQVRDIVRREITEALQGLSADLDAFQFIIFFLLLYRTDKINSVTPKSTMLSTTRSISQSPTDSPYRLLPRA